LAGFLAFSKARFVGVTSVDQKGERVALEVHIFAEDLRGTGEGHYPWDLIKGPSTMTNATIAEIEDTSAVERVLRLTYKGDGQDAGEQIIRVPDFADVVRLESAPDRSVLAPDRPAFLVVQDATPIAIAIAIALGEGVTPPM
jgi:hypothetical protein